jgi:hypothetical protein
MHDRLPFLCWTLWIHSLFNTLTHRALQFFYLHHALSRPNRRVIVMYKKSGESLPPSVRRLQGIIRRTALAAALLAAPVLAHSQNTVERWRLVVSPVLEARTLHSAIQQQLQQSLHQPVDMYFDNAQPPQPLQGAARRCLPALDRAAE